MKGKNNETPNNLKLTSRGPVFSEDRNLIDINLEELFVIKDGFDFNDNDEVTLHAQLPSACYKPALVSLVKQGEFQYKANFKVKK